MIDVQAAYEFIYSQLSAAPQSAVFGGRIQPDSVTAGTVKPYVVFWRLGGGEVNNLKRSDSSLLIGVKCVAIDINQALTAAEEIADRLNDAETANGGPIDAGDWWITSVTREETIHMIELIDGGRLYHSGNHYRINLEVKS